ncbi:hypothetical protein MRB53_019543 [Persea americana]|uniref:Uncharacterized protein n=1 Tax=Persea americana TaxID=3435 RepID=A0ACC2KYK3_PERAE|nr:hypothetical protein MRB53_019543 [Persea americana]
MDSASRSRAKPGKYSFQSSMAVVVGGQGVRIRFVLVLMFRVWGRDPRENFVLVGGMEYLVLIGFLSRMRRV